MSTIDDLTNDPRLGVVRLDKDAKLPTKAHYGDLGYDLYSLEDIELKPGQTTLVRTGIACNFPPGYGALIRDRSSVATKRQLYVVAGVIDQGYTGEIRIAFYNPGTVSTAVIENLATGEQKTVVRDPERSFTKGEKIAQMILFPVVTIPVEEVTELQDSSRGAGGFGSSGT